MLQVFIQKFRNFKSGSVLLGRWSRTEKILNDVKVDLANVDHCGVCTITDYSDVRKVKMSEIKDDKQYDMTIQEPKKN
jgi:hypothetical protein